MWRIGRVRLKELVNHVECNVRDNLGNPSVAVARFAGGTEIWVGNVTAPVFFRRAPAPAPRRPASVGAGGAGPRWLPAGSGAPSHEQTRSSHPGRWQWIQTGPCVGLARGRSEGHRA